ncbi:MAG: hypothetical protein DYG91_06170 [Chloroflexi bacterium CFX7]|nr:hypothetical protein [Chloroflexi bacterium CFX7]
MTSTHDRPRVIFPKDWSFDLSDELVDRIRGEFEPDDVVAELAPKVAGKPIGEAEGIARAYFVEFGRRWMDRTIELGEEYADRTYLNLKAAVAKTGEMGFPLIPERFIEVAYLSTQPIYSLPIVEASRDAFVFKMVFCDTIAELREQCGDELADRLPCSNGCLAAVDRAFSATGYPADVVQDASVVGGEFCQFTARPRAG